MPGILQSQIKASIGLTFASMLRSLVRSDPDIIMIGEIRDRETALIATEASLTGHLVLSTLHTNDAASAVTRLMEMETPSLPHRVGPRVRGRAAACPETLPALQEDGHAHPGEHDPSRETNSSGSPKRVIARAVGCNHCFGTGYSGRIGLFELLPVDPRYPPVDPGERQRRRHPGQGSLRRHEDAS